MSSIVSEKLRRSERLKAKEQANQNDKEEVVPGSDQEKLQDNSSKALSKSRKSQVSQLKRAELENAIKKNQLKQEELKKKQELLELEFALKLVELQEEKSSMESESVHESISKPNIEDWIHGQIPWDRKLLEKHTQQIKNSMTLDLDECQKVRNCHSYSHDYENKISHLENNHFDEMALPQITKILTRQSVPKDLPVFDGNPIEWPNFIYQYHNSTRICGYTNEENQSRLQKCLKGNARKVVQSLLILPQNVENVIKLLESRFGRSENIILLLLKKLRKFPHIKEDKLNLIVEFSDEVKNLVATIESLKDEDHLCNPMLLYELLDKLPSSYRMSWGEHISRIGKPKYKLVELVNWLDKKASIITQIQFQNFDDTFDSNNYKSRNMKRDVTLTTNNRHDKRCYCCNNEVHHLSLCSKFKSLSCGERWSFILKRKLCISCLTPFHNVKICKKKKMCGVDNCPKPHHELLHNPETVIPENQTNTEIANTETNCHISMNKNVLLKIVPVIITQGSTMVETYALLDDASTITLIDQEFADSLHLSGPQKPLCLQWTDNDVVHHQEDSRIVSFTISTKENQSSFQLRHVRTTKLSLPSQTIEVEELRCQYPYISNKIKSMQNAQPKIIIGQDNWPLIVNRKLIAGKWNGPALSKTLLGWVLHGNVSSNHDSSQFMFRISCNDYSEKDDLDILHDMVKEQWKMDTIHTSFDKILSIEDRRAQDILDRTMKRIGNRFETGLLWKNENITLPESKSNALRRLKCTERKMDRNRNYGEFYCKKFLELETKGYIRKLKKEELEEPSGRTWYLPHFGVVNPNKPDKLRIVFDASAKNNGVSLNDFLLTGPDLYNSLYKILLNFRIKKYAFTADIREMFLQVRVRKEDRCAQRILWRGMDRNIEPNVYEIDVVFFGSTCGPCLAQEAKNRNANDFKDKYPEANKAILEQHYMDDYLGGADTEVEAKTLIRDVTYVHRQGGFVICNWISNSQEILKDIDDELKSVKDKNLEANDQTSTERVLGVFWHPIKDTFKFHTKFHKVPTEVLEGKRKPTKREVLKVIMSIFDPLGVLTNFTIQGKVLLQDIWRSQIKILKEILKSRYPPEHILRLCLIECENILNSRPLTHVSLDSNDAEPLTPNHFLIGPSYAALPFTVSEDKDLNLLNHWRATQKLADLFWTRWTKEYLPTLVKRTKWYEESKPIQVGDIVIVVDPNGPRNLWQKAIVVNVYSAKDGKIRMVDVKNSRGTIFRRPLSRLIVLDIK